MFVVGLDVDTLVSFSTVTYFNTIWPFAGNFKRRVSPPGSTTRPVGKILSFFPQRSFGVLNNQQVILTRPQPASFRTDPEVIFDFDAPELSDHMQKHRKPETDRELGYYLAGLIEGDGYIGAKRLEIAFHMDDISSAYYIKKRVGYGNVLFLKGKNSVRYVVRKLAGLERIYKLINGKLLGQPKINQLLGNRYAEQFGLPTLPPASFNLLTNHWLSGFTDADGSFGIFIVRSKTHANGHNIRLPFRVKQKGRELPDLIYGALGGHVYQFSDGMYEYTSTNFKVAHAVASYFDNFHLLNASKYINYLKWRDTYRMIQRKEHLTFEGLAKIRKLKENLRD